MYKRQVVVAAVAVVAVAVVVVVEVVVVVVVAELATYYTRKWLTHTVYYTQRGLVALK